MKLEKIVGDMILAAVEASIMINDIYNRGFDITYKNDDSPLTSADIASNTAITSRLRNAYPEFSILTEEEEDSCERLTNQSGVFIIDPLDGTKEFVNRNGEFCVSIALAVSRSISTDLIATRAIGYVLPS